MPDQFRKTIGLRGRRSCRGIAEGNVDREVEYVSQEFMGRIKKLLCPACGNLLERASSPGGAMSFGDAKPECEYWDFYCINEKCHKIWRVPRTLYEVTFGEWLK